MSKNREKNHRNIEKPRKKRQIYRKNVKNLDILPKTTKNIEKTSKM